MTHGNLIENIVSQHVAKWIDDSDQIPFVSNGFLVDNILW